MRFPEQLKTARLELRMPDPARAPAVNEAIRESFDTLSRWMDWADHIPSIEETRARLVRSRQKFLADEDYGLHIFLTDPLRFLGSAGLHPRPADEGRREIGYWIRDTATGQGYATETVRAIAAAAFESLHLACIEIRASARNVASHRVAERAGFVLDAVVSDGRVDPDGESSDTHVYILSRDVP
jgi:RimJ/RimL family protein N-acetyltransferase